MSVRNDTLTVDFAVRKQMNKMTWRSRLFDDMREHRRTDSNSVCHFWYCPKSEWFVTSYGLMWLGL